MLRRLRKIARQIDKPVLSGQSRTYEVDELWTYIGNKSNDYWVAYALDRTTREVAGFMVGKRTRSTLKTLIEQLLVASPKSIRTDKLTHYQRIIPKDVHRLVHIALITLNGRT